MLLEYFKLISNKIYSVHDYILWSITFGVMHTMFSPKRNRDIFAYFFAATTCIPVGVLAGLTSKEFELQESTTYVIVSISALLAQDIIKFLLGSAGFINSHRDTVLNSIIEYIEKRFLKSDHNKDKADN